MLEQVLFSLLQQGSASAFSNPKYISSLYRKKSWLLIFFSPMLVSRVRNITFCSIKVSRFLSLSRIPSFICMAKNSVCLASAVGSLFCCLLELEFISQTYTVRSKNALHLSCQFDVVCWDSAKTMKPDD